MAVNPVITGPRSKFALLANTWTLEFPEPTKRAFAEQLVEAMFAHGRIEYV